MIRMKIKDICDLQNGRAFKPSDWGTAGLPIIRIQNLNDERAPFNYYGGKYNLAQEVDNGDLLFSWSGTPGTSFGAFLWNRGKGVLNQHIFKVIPKVEVDKTYLMYALNGNISTIISKAHGGVGLQHITKKELDEIEIQMVSISRQKKIVEILEKISLLIFLRKQQLAKLDELVKARFVEMFGELHKTEYNIKTLDELCEFIKDGTHQTPTYVDATEGYKFLSSKDVTSGYIDWNSIKYISEELHQELYKRIAPQRGDILLAKNGTTGIPAIVETDETFDIYVSLALLRLKPNNNVRYIWLALRMPETKAQFDNSLKGVGVPNLHLGEIKKTKIIVPPFSLQNQFAAFVERVDKQKQTVQQSLEKLELMKKALMQEYFG